MSGVTDAAAPVPDAPRAPAAHTHDHASPPVRATATTSRCDVHGRHQPRSHVQEHHHIWPQALGGPSTPDNLVWVCATGHNNIHRLMTRMRQDATHGLELGPEELRAYHPEEIRLARLGHRRATEQRM